MKIKLKLNQETSGGKERNSPVTPKTNSNISPTSAGKGSAFTSYWLKMRSLRKTKAKLPSTPKRRVEILDTLTDSPSTSKILETRGRILTNKTRKKLKMADKVMSSVKALITETKVEKPSKSDKPQAFRVLAHTVISSGKATDRGSLSSLKRYYQIEEAQKLVG